MFRFFCSSLLNLYSLKNLLLRQALLYTTVLFALTAHSLPSGGLIEDLYTEETISTEFILGSFQVWSYSDSLKKYLKDPSCLSTLLNQRSLGGLDKITLAKKHENMVLVFESSESTPQSPISFRGLSKNCANGACSLRPNFKNNTYEIKTHRLSEGGVIHVFHLELSPAELGAMELNQGSTNPYKSQWYLASNYSAKLFGLITLAEHRQSCLLSN